MFAALKVIIGEEFETARMHLTKRLPGNAAWRRAA